uniref:Uncharacterized protein n=1 Tax=Strigamia maritima TaxID=126957 RepID=T1J8N1_STRMM
MAPLIHSHIRKHIRKCICNTYCDYSSDHISDHLSDNELWRYISIVKLQSCDLEKNVRFVVHAIHRLANLAETTQAFFVSQSKEEVALLDVDFDVFIRSVGGILEVVVAKWWVSIGDPCINWKHPGEGIFRANVTSPLKHEDVSPNVEEFGSSATTDGTKDSSTWMDQEIFCRKDDDGGREISYRFV